ncbi:trans-aconitate 2-methyltransferase [Pelagibius sp. Alg239-R121]|uniref:class I SAM-dependent methyltransferase n=1 Tax=Pelagibius sp. Alg239-R121 TaxID=2993448 RepID=UPI0024A686BE|nr:methyltransferase domain-containing protein [Pelagibius sp. Alg239-R121]
MAKRPSNRARNIWTLDLLNIQPADRVLEVGCGPGFALTAAAARLPRGRILGLDHSAVMLQQAEVRNRAEVKSGRIELRLGNLDTAVAPMEAFDKIYWVNVVQFLDDKDAALARLFDALVPGGILATTYVPRGRGAHRADALVMA